MRPVGAPMESRTFSIPNGFPAAFPQTLCETIGSYC